MNDSGSRGFSLMEILIGGALLVFILTGVAMLARTSSTGNMLARDLSDGSARLNAFVDSMRSLNPAALTKNSEQMRTSGTDTTRWRVYDNAGGAPYAQPPNVFLLTAKFTWKKTGRVHHVETSTFLGI